MMDLSLNKELGRRYDSLAQKARIITEAWVRDNLYCLGCLEDRLTTSRPGRAVIDFRCRNCGRRYQLKSQRRPFRNRVLDAAWQPMASAVRAGKAPNFLFLHYDVTDWMVMNLFGVPNHFMTLSAIERRRPLARGAKRSGWVGCNILLGQLPWDAKVHIVRDYREVPREKVRRRWSRFDFLQDAAHESRGWTADILVCVRRLNQRMFTLDDVYGFEDELARLHPRNRHIGAKIRQQLQILRDQGIIKFLGEGHYLLVD
ncbi:MAG: DpnI domain-containing protein [Thermoplasmata archaeon]